MSYSFSPFRFHAEAFALLEMLKGDVDTAGRTSQTFEQDINNNLS